MSTVEYRVLSTDEQNHVLPLLARCFQAYWEQTALTCTEYPYNEISHGAIVDGQIVGHVGVIPYRMSDGNGGFPLLGGLASVAVDPDYRGRGIAKTLCQSIAEWARREGYQALPLYTGKDRVYESAGWSTYPGMRPFYAQFSQHADSQQVMTGAQLTQEEKLQIRRLYEQGEDFCGKVVRGNGKDYLGWDRLMKDADYTYAIGDGVYAIFMDGAVVECNAAPQVSDAALLAFLHRLSAPSGTLELAPPQSSRVRRALQAANVPMTPSDHDLMHGEHPMNLDIDAPGLFASLPLVEFPLADKF